MAQKRRCAIWNIILGIWLLGAVVVDLRTYKIPNRFCLCMIGCGFLLQGYAHGVEGLLAGGQGMLIGFATLYGLFWIRVLGAGDVKLFCAIGAFMGKEVWNVLQYTCIFAGGLAVGKLAVILAKRRKMPFLSEAERTEGVRMHMSVPILLGYIAYVTGGVSIGI